MRIINISKSRMAESIDKSTLSLLDECKTELNATFSHFNLEGDEDLGMVEHENKSVSSLDSYEMPKRRTAREVMFEKSNKKVESPAVQPSSSSSSSLSSLSDKKEKPKRVLFLNQKEDAVDLMGAISIVKEWVKRFPQSKLMEFYLLNQIEVSEQILIKCANELSRRSMEASWDQLDEQWFHVLSGARMQKKITDSAVADNLMGSIRNLLSEYSNSNQILKDQNKNVIEATSQLQESVNSSIKQISTEVNRVHDIVQSVRRPPIEPVLPTTCPAPIPTPEKSDIKLTYGTISLHVIKTTGEHKVVADPISKAKLEIPDISHLSSLLKSLPREVFSLIKVQDIKTYWSSVTRLNVTTDDLVSYLVG